LQVGAHQGVEGVDVVDPGRHQQHRPGTHVRIHDARRGGHVPGGQLGPGFLGRVGGVDAALPGQGGQRGAAGTGPPGRQGVAFGGVPLPPVLGERDAVDGLVDRCEGAADADRA
jgi:hypothetical protein